MDKISYALGVSIGHHLRDTGVHDVNSADFMRAVESVLSGEKLEMLVTEVNEILSKYFDDIQKAEAEASKKEGEEWLKKMSEEEGVVATGSGLLYKVISQGTGKKPGKNSRVKCHYVGMYPDGRKFDSSVDRGTPAVFGLDQVIAGWTEGLQLMPAGSKFEFYIPYQLGYGERGVPGAIPGYSALHFSVELIEVM